MGIREHCSPTFDSISSIKNKIEKKINKRNKNYEKENWNRLFFFFLEMLTRINIFNIEDFNISTDIVLNKFGPSKYQNKKVIEQGFFTLKNVPKKI